MAADRRIVVVGLGGIGSWVLQALVPFLNSGADTWTLVLVDGDEYEEKNRTRQCFEELGAKADVQAGWIARRFPRLRVQPLAQYLSADGAEGTLPVRDAIRSGDVVFSCVDNHRTRKTIADHCAGLRDTTLISGGNEYTDGNVQVFVRRQGQDMTCRLEKYHPEFISPSDKAPYEMSCEELAASSPQLIFANLTAATLMLNAFYALEQKEYRWDSPEVYFDIVANAAAPRVRK
ncbi:MAG: ThiF family adenylyltransferase [Candidatus Moranbacteria bacterium]|nr:ThiF family adenylyltransferase [Candidatus Moranbacteria bacterium]